jgi:hypothetical protein
LPREMSGFLDPLEQYGMIILLIAIFLLPRMGLDLFGIILIETSIFLVRLLLFGA